MATASETRACTACGARMPVEARFCPACGHEAPAPAAAAPRAASGESASPPAGAASPDSVVQPGEDARIGTVVSQRYRIIERIARGGMGEVYLARHDELDQRVAVKLLYAKFAEDERLAQRFFNEARSASRVNHPYAVTIYDFGQLEDGTFYIVMEYVKGRSLSQLVRRQGPLHPHLALRICAQLCEVLGTAHEQRLIHRDIKPDNIMVIEGAGGRFSVKVLDFGIAKILDDELSGDLTQTGMTFGTPEYMSPEQASGGPIDLRTDIYSLGVVLFYSLVGRPPFQGKNKLQLLQRHINEEPPRVTESAGQRLPTALTALIARCLAKDATQRPGSMAEMLREVERILPQVPAPPEILRRPTSEVVASARSSRRVVEEEAPRRARSTPGRTADASSAQDRGRRQEAPSHTGGLGGDPNRPTTDLSMEAGEAPSAAWALGGAGDAGREAEFAFGDEGAPARSARAREGSPSAAFSLDTPELSDDAGLAFGEISGPLPTARPAMARSGGFRRLLAAAVFGLLVFGAVVFSAWYLLEGPDRPPPEEDAATAPEVAAYDDEAEEEEGDEEVPQGPPPWAEALEEAQEHFDAGRVDRTEAALNQLAESWPMATGEALETLRQNMRRFRTLQEEVEGHLAEGNCRPADELVITLRNELNQALAARFYGALSACRDDAQAERRRATEAEQAERREQQEAQEARERAERERAARERAERERRERERREREAEQERTRPPPSL